MNLNTDDDDSSNCYDKIISNGDIVVRAPRDREKILMGSKL